MRLKRISTWFGRHYGKIGLIWAISLVVYIFCLPPQLFEAKYSTVILDREGQLLGAKIAADGQWRFPPSDTIPHKFRQALILFEDKRFDRHWGLDFRALGRALISNYNAGHE